MVALEFLELFSAFYEYFEGLRMRSIVSIPDYEIIWLRCSFPKLLFPQINLVVFVLVIRKMMGTKHVQSKSQADKLRTGVKATAVVLPLLGVTWVFSLLAFESAAVTFKYLFAIFNSLQGLMIFVFHCLLNKQVWAFIVSCDKPLSQACAEQG